MCATSFPDSRYSCASSSSPIDGDLAEQVGYEAQQQIPFPIDQIQYSYQQLSDTPEGDKEVLLVAIKKEVLDSLNSEVEGNGLKTKAVDCSITSSTTRTAPTTRRRMSR